MEELTPLYIFDLDGTLADIEHRRKFIKGDKKDWDSFFAACPNDVPKYEIIDILQTLRLCSNDVWIWSGRSDVVKKETLEWIHKFINENDESGSGWRFFNPSDLKMRPHGDYSPDTELKKRWLDAMSIEDRARLMAVFDDRNCVVNMWRKNGITCLQVAAGDF